MHPWISKLLGRIHVPPEILAQDGPWLIHISDTPAVLFPQLSTLFKTLKPEIIIHTGDLVDNIKLELYPNLIDVYTRDVIKLIKILKATDAKTIYICIGNHDSADVLTDLDSRFIIVKGSTSVDLPCGKSTLSHWDHTALAAQGGTHFFGHNIISTSGEFDGKLYKNGIEAISLFNISTGQWFELQYPIGTDDARLRRRRIGL